MAVIYFSRENILQWAFALSPFPAYLPQYFSMMEQLAPPSSSTAADGNGDGDASTTQQQPAHNMAIERGGDYHNHHLRKRNFLDSPSSANYAKTIITTPSPNSAGAAFGLPGTPSKPSSLQMNYNLSSSSHEEEKDNKSDTGLSRATVLLLLSAHLLRLLYFHGLLLEESRPVPPIASAGDELITPSAVPPPTTEQQHNSAMQWDLLGQSLSMIVIQLMLLHAMMLLRRRQLRRRRASDGGVAAQHQHQSTDSLGQMTSTSPNNNFGYNQNNLSPTANGGININNNTASSATPSFWRSKWHQCSRTTTAHFHHLLSPHNILQTHSFLQYLELLFLSSMAVKLMFDYRWYPMYRMLVVDWLKHASIVLESCLALPQAVRNYRKGTTEGLSVVMVGGWVAGDFFKLCYFLFSMIGGDAKDDSSSSNNNNMGVFALGCILAISLDSIVAIQMAWWYPQPETIEWQERILRIVRHWKTNKDDDAGESLLLGGSASGSSSGGKKKSDGDGLIVSFLRSFFQWARGIRPSSNNSS